MDKLIHYANANSTESKVNFLYSTPSIYAEAKLDQASSWPLKTDDFFPYCDGAHACWSSFFTSRAALKGYVRDTSAVFQASKQMQFFAQPPADMSQAANPLFRLERAMGVTQHHDGVSGTSKQAVAYDYARRLAWGREDAAAANAGYLGKLSGYAAPGAYATCDLSNATICAALQAAPPVANASVLEEVRHAAPVRVEVVHAALWASARAARGGGEPEAEARRGATSQVRGRGQCECAEQSGQRPHRGRKRGSHSGRRASARSFCSGMRLSDATAEQSVVASTANQQRAGLVGSCISSARDR